MFTVLTEPSKKIEKFKVTNHSVMSSTIRTSKKTAITDPISGNLKPGFTDPN